MSREATCNPTKGRQIFVQKESRTCKKGKIRAESIRPVYPDAGRVTGGFSRVAFEPRLPAKPRPFTNLSPEAVSRTEGLIIHVTSTPHHKESATAVARRIFGISVPYERYPAPVTVNYRSSSVINCLLDRWNLLAVDTVGRWISIPRPQSVQIIFTRLGYGVLLVGYRILLQSAIDIAIEVFFDIVWWILEDLQSTMLKLRRMVRGYRVLSFFRVTFISIQAEESYQYKFKLLIRILECSHSIYRDSGMFCLA